MPKLDISALREAVADNHYFISTHAKRRMGHRKVSDVDIKRVIETGDVIERYPNARPLPKVLLMARVKGEPLYVACAFDGRFAHIITSTGMIQISGLIRGRVGRTDYASQN